MDLTPFKEDINDLLDEFNQKGLLGFADFKQVWLSRKFSYIYEGRPKTNLAVFMQGIYAHCIGHFISTGSLSQRLGGLYCLYCLYRTQPFKPFFKIYLSLGELRRLREIILDAKQNGIGVVTALVKKMLEGKMFLFGSVDIVGTSVAQRVDEITRLNDRRAQIAYERLMANTRIEDYLHMNLGDELELEGLKKMSAEYAQAKELAIKEASGTVDVGDVKHITENKNLLGDRIGEIVEGWNAQKEIFYKETSITPRNEIVAVDNDIAVDADADFDQELKYLLTD